MIKVTACDTATGIVLDESYEWHTHSNALKSFERCFESLEDANSFCHEEIRKRNDLEFWINDGESKPIRFAIDTIK